MKKNYLICLFSVLAIGLINFFPILKHVQNEIKREVRFKILKNQISDSETIRFTSLDLKSAVWFEDDEFVLNNKLYDVIEKNSLNGITVYKCFADKDETGIKNIQETISSLFKIDQNNKDIKSPKSQIVRICYPFIEIKNQLPSFYVYNGVKFHNVYGLSHYTFEFSSKTIHPPRS